MIHFAGIFDLRNILDKVYFHPRCFIFSELSVISAQEDLPKCVLDSVDAGNDASKMKVLSPRDLIELYIGEDNVEADHLDFKKALDLIDYLAPVGMTLDEFEVEKVRSTHIHIVNAILLADS